MITSLGVAVVLTCGLLKGALDKSSRGDYNNVYFNKEHSWKNKWALTPTKGIVRNYKRPWYYLGLYKPKYIERFPYSSTLLVSLTDGWHMIQSIIIHTTMLSLNTSLLMNKDDSFRLDVDWVSFLIYSVLFRVAFEVFHRNSWFIKK